MLQSSKDELHFGERLAQMYFIRITNSTMCRLMFLLIVGFLDKLTTLIVAQINFLYHSPPKMVNLIFFSLGNSSKYPYHTTDDFSEFRGQGGWGEVFELEFWRHGGVQDMEFPQGVDKSIFLEKLILWT